MNINQHFPPIALAWFMWALGGAFYLFGFYQRVAPAVMTDELAQDFSLDAAGLGNLSAFYFYSYVAMQIPTGILADRIGPRRLLTLGAIVTSIGTYVFSQANSVHWAEFGRLLVGGGVAVAFVCMLKLADHWLAPKYFALASGLALFAGVMGAVFAGVPLRLAIDAVGWREAMFVSSMIPLFIGTAIWLLVRDDPEEKGYKSYGHVDDSDTKTSALSGLITLLRYKNTWIITLVPGGVVGSVLTFAGLWGVPFLTQHYGVSKTEAAGMNTLLLVAWAVGGPIFGAMSDRIGKRKSIYAASVAFLLVLWWVLIFVPNLPILVLLALLACIGFISGCMVIGFAFAKESVPRKLSGTVGGIANMGVMLGPMILQPAVGLVLDAHGVISDASGTLAYSLQAYQAGFSLFLGWLVLGLILMMLSRETYCRHLELIHE